MPKFKVYFKSQQMIEWTKVVEAENQSDAMDLVALEDPEMDESWTQVWDDVEYGVEYAIPMKESDGN